ncbi:aldo/keto reductase [Mesobacterium pallidum]|uniref:aldo/keto reductase n=1 Tax=Mesobacterium pallidum TaxID=2872037 RepID=UPI001EE2F387|nr:aldo/keto reductase [Mesobacterium pallidum]
MTDRIQVAGTGLALSPLCLGGNRLGGDLDRDASFALLDAFAAAGGNFIDTAHVYADWLPGVERSCSERMIGRWLADRRPEGMVVATKIGHPPLGTPGVTRLDPRSLRQDVEEALENLGLACLPLVYLHRDDDARPVEDILGALEELVAGSMVARYAASNWSAKRLATSSETARANGWQGFVANQAEWSLARRTPGSAAADLHAMDPAMIDWHRRSGALATPYSAQAKGYFDKLRAGTMDAATANAYDNQANRERGARLIELSRRYDAAPTEIMLALFRDMPFPVIPVVGCRTPAQVASSFRGQALDLAPEDRAAFAADLGLDLLSP